MLTLDELAEVMERLQGTQTQNGDLGVYGTEKKFLQLQNVYQAMLHLNGKGPSRETGEWLGVRVRGRALLC
jgi:hypothetical protein